MSAAVTRGRMSSRAYVITIPKKFWEEMRWRHGDAFSIRAAGDKVILERIPLEKFSIVKTSPLEATPR